MIRGSRAGRHGTSTPALRPRASVPDPRSRWSTNTPYTASPIRVARRQPYLPASTPFGLNAVCASSYHSGFFFAGWLSPLIAALIFAPTPGFLAGLFCPNIPSCNLRSWARWAKVSGLQRRQRSNRKGSKSFTAQLRHLMQPSQSRDCPRRGQNGPAHFWQAWAGLDCLPLCLRSCPTCFGGFASQSGFWYIIL